MTSETSAGSLVVRVLLHVIAPVLFSCFAFEFWSASGWLGLRFGACCTGHARCSYRKRDVIPVLLFSPSNVPGIRPLWTGLLSDVIDSNFLATVCQRAFASHYLQSDLDKGDRSVTISDSCPQQSSYVEPSGSSANTDNCKIWEL